MSRAVCGSCLCGAVAFSGHVAEDTGVFVCHCGQCRRWSAGPLMVTRFEDGVEVAPGAPLAWYASSEHGERGFCTRCGTTLFWREPGAERHWEVSVNALGDDHGLSLAAHIWVDFQPGWYDFADDAPRRTSAEILAEDG